MAAVVLAVGAVFWRLTSLGEVAAGMGGTGGTGGGGASSSSLESTKRLRKLLFWAEEDCAAAAAADLRLRLRLRIEKPPSLRVVGRASSDESDE